MKRSEMIRALGEILMAGGEATEILVVVRMREGDASGPGKAGVFGDVESAVVAQEMLRTAWMWIEREQRVVDSSGVLIAMLRPAQGSPN